MAIIRCSVLLTHCSNESPDFQTEGPQGSFQILLWQLHSNRSYFSPQFNSIIFLRKSCRTFIGVKPLPALAREINFYFTAEVCCSGLNPQLNHCVCSAFSQSLLILTLRWLVKLIPLLNRSLLFLWLFDSFALGYKTPGGKKGSESRQKILRACVQDCPSLLLHLMCQV